MSRTYCQTCRGRGRIRGALGSMIPCPSCTPYLTKAERAQRKAAVDNAYAPRPGDPTYQKMLENQQKLFGDKT